MATALPPSPMTLGGLVKHLALVEESWFCERLGGRDAAGAVGVGRLGRRRGLGLAQRRRRRARRARSRQWERSVAMARAVRRRGHGRRPGSTR
ncbi:MAG: DUF664 domain-containing protein [Ilumatobacteraceae bacterium]